MGKDRAAEQNIALVVDDDPDSLTMVSAALEENGMSVIVARDGQTAIELVGRVNPDVVLMDAIMPNLDGFETCRRLKKGQQATDAPIIFMTGLTESVNVVRGLKAGGVDYITKPVVVDELLARNPLKTTAAVAEAKEAYATYGKATAPLLADVGGSVVWRGKFELTFIGPSDETWDAMFIVHYPNAKAFLQMITSAAYQKLVVHRQAAVKTSRLIRTQNLELTDSFA